MKEKFFDYLKSRNMHCKYVKGSVQECADGILILLSNRAERVQIGAICEFAKKKRLEAIFTAHDNKIIAFIRQKRAA